MIKETITIVIYAIVIIGIFLIIKKSNVVTQENMTTNHRGEIGFSTTCIDLRFVDEEQKYLEDKLIGKDLYDTFVLPGAALALSTNSKGKYIDEDFFTTWKKTLDISIALHGTKKIFIIDHEDCGYYKKYYTKDNFGQDYAALNKDEKYKIHIQNMTQTIEQLVKYLSSADLRALHELNPVSTYNDITVEGHIIKMNGSGTRIVEPVLITREGEVEKVTLTH